MQTARVVALGYFDGVHLGHGALLARAASEAKRLGVTPAAMTFDTHPDALLTGRDVALLNTADDRALLMKRLYGVDEVLTLHFDRAMMDLPWQRFAEEYLLRRFGAAAVVCGYDFRFGARGEGTAQKLAEFCRVHGVGCDVIAEVRLDGQTVSSTRIRELVRQGEMRQAVQLLGHPHLLTGTVQAGNRLGRTLGIPTANLAFPAGVQVPAFGVYAAMAYLPDAAYIAAVNIGVHPTVGALPAPIAEAWLQDFSGDLYGAPLHLEFYTRLRGERTFASAQEMADEIRRNADEARRLLRGVIKEKKEEFTK